MRPRKEEALGEDVHPHAVALHLPQLLHQLPWAALVLDGGDHPLAGGVPGLPLQLELEYRTGLLGQEASEGVRDYVSHSLGNNKATVSIYYQERDMDLTWW